MNYNDLPHIDNEQVMEWIKEYRLTNDEALKKKLAGFVFVAYSPLAKTIVHSFARRASDPFEDLFQVASIGIIKALNSFNEHINKNFKTYATSAIVGEIRHYLRDKTSLIRAPRQIKELSFRIKKITEELTQTLGQVPNDEEIARELEISQNKIAEAINSERRTTIVSMDKITTENENMLEILSDKDSVAQYQAYISEKDYSLILKEATKMLDETSRKIIEMSFFEEYSQAQIAKQLGLSPMSVSRKMKKALQKLFVIIKGKGINEYE